MKCPKCNSKNYYYEDEVISACRDCGHIDWENCDIHACRIIANVVCVSGKEIAYMKYGRLKTEAAIKVVEEWRKF